MIIKIEKNTNLYGFMKMVSRAKSSSFVSNNNWEARKFVLDFKKKKIYCSDNHRIHVLDVSNYWQFENLELEEKIYSIDFNKAGYLEINEEVSDPIDFEKVFPKETKNFEFNGKKEFYFSEDRNTRNTDLSLFVNKFPFPIRVFWLKDLGDLEYSVEYKEGKEYPMAIFKCAEFTALIMGIVLI